MTEQHLEDPLLAAVRSARPQIDEAVLTPTSADALNVLERVLQGEDPRTSAGSKARQGQKRVRSRLGRGIDRVWRPRTGAIAIAAAAVVAAVVIVLSGVSGGPSLVDRAYADINAGYVVVHEVDIETDHGLRGYYDRTEGWLLPADGRTRLIGISGYEQHPYRTVTESIVTVDGRVFGRACLAGCTAGNADSFINGRSRWGSEGTGGFGMLGPTPGTFARMFSDAYRAHAVVPDGSTTFNGRHVRQFQSVEALVGPTAVYWRPGAPIPMSVRKTHALYGLFDWYIDPATARPIGFSARECIGSVSHSCDRSGELVSTTRIVTFQRLDATPQNLALLTGPNAPAGAR